MMTSIKGTIPALPICDNYVQRSFADYARYLYGYVFDMFKWSLDFAPEYIMEYYLTTRGTLGIFYNGGDPVIASGGYCGEPDRYGMGMEYIGGDFTGNTYRGTVGEDVVVIWNNKALVPDLHTVASYAQAFCECDKSTLNVLRGARITNLVTATDNTDKLTLDNVIKAINNGDTVVKIPPAYRDIDALDNGIKRFDVLRLTDPKDNDKIQYLSRYRDDLLSKFLREYGLDVDMINKGSQISNDELHSMGDAVSAVIDSRLQLRRRDLDIVRSWGYDISVRPGVCRDIREEVTGNDTGNNNTDVGGRVDTDGNIND